MDLVDDVFGPIESLLKDFSILSLGKAAAEIM